MSSNPASSEARIAKSIGYKVLAKRAVRTVLWLIALAAVIYLIIASSMTRYVATDLGTMRVASTNFTGGSAPAGALVLVDPVGGHDGNPLKNLATAFTPHGGVLMAEIVEGPYGDVDWKSYGLEMDQERLLSNEYIAQCIEGCDVENSFVLISADQIMGIPVEYV